MTLVVTTTLIALLWLSHRLYDAYIHAVSREERSRRPHWYERLGHPSNTPRSHWGPKIFALFDLGALLGLVSTLRFSWDSLSGGLWGWAESLVFASLLFAVWLVVEGRHMQRFYQHMMRSARFLRRDDQAQWAFEDSLLGRDSGASRWIVAGLLGWTAIPLVASFLGHPILTSSSGNAEIFASFIVWFALPIGLLLLWIGRYLFALRSRVYR